MLSDRERVLQPRGRCMRGVAKYSTEQDGAFRERRALAMACSMQCDNLDKPVHKEIKVATAIHAGQ